MILLHRVIASVATALLVVPAVLAAQPRASAASPPYRDARLPVERRVDDLLARMTLEEKVAQMLGIWQGKANITDAGDRPLRSRTRAALVPRRHRAHRAAERPARRARRGGVHQRGAAVDAGQHAARHPRAVSRGSAARPAGRRRRRASRRRSASRARGIPSSSSACSPPSRRRSARAGAQQVLAPVVDVAREPRWGRIEETYGEDPYLTSRLAVAAVRGFQGTGRLWGAPPSMPADRVIATLKHMTGHGQPESGTNTGPAPLGENTLRNFFFPPFEAAVKEAHAGSLMPSYNEVDGVPVARERVDAARRAARRVGVRWHDRLRLGRDPRARQAASRRRRSIRGGASRTGRHGRRGPAGHRVVCASRR